MMRRTAILSAFLALSLSAAAQNITLKATDRPAAEVFRSIIQQSDRNFVYSSDLLRDMRITLDVRKRPLKKVLNDIFRDTDIEYKIKGKNVVLKKKTSEKPKKTESPKKVTAGRLHLSDSVKITMLQPVDVVSQSETHPLQTAKLGINTLSGTTIGRAPAILGEPDLVKALQILPGVAEANAGFSGMNVHGGGPDENLYLLDNVSLYQVDHFAGLFSPFNTDIVRQADFYKTSVPARFDGRLSSFLDVHLKKGTLDGHHGSGRLGLTSGAFNIAGPIGGKTTYMVGLRRSWYDVLAIPILAIVNSQNKSEKTILRYHFMDFNARVDHRFSDRVTGFVNAYYGDDRLKTGTEDKKKSTDPNYYKEIHDFKWGNILAQAGVNWRMSETLTGEFSAAYTGYFSGMGYDVIYSEIVIDDVPRDRSHDKMWSSNNIDAFNLRGDFNWKRTEAATFRFGAGYTYHSFLPERNEKENTFNDITVKRRDLPERFGANEANAYAEYDWNLSDRLHAEAGLHASLFHIDGKAKGGVSPRFAFSWQPTSRIAVKGAYSRTLQYVHRIDQTYLSLPCDRWVPAAGDFKPMTADKIGIGGYWQTEGGDYAVTLDAYWKWMHNIIDFRDEYYLQPQSWSWSERLTAGKGSAKGIDLMIEKKTGKLTGHISYSLAWADRQFADRNGGHPYPARFDHRHTVKVFANWDISRKVSLSALWTGHSGNRFTLLPQRWEDPDLPGAGYPSEISLKAPVNNYQLPFYHRLDLSLTVRNRRGYWTFGLYNAYCNMNTIAIQTGIQDITKYTNPGDGVWTVEYSYKPVFQKMKLLPTIPSISYTWLF